MVTCAMRCEGRADALIGVRWLCDGMRTAVGLVGRWRLKMRFIDVDAGAGTQNVDADAETQVRTRGDASSPLEVSTGGGLYTGRKKHKEKHKKIVDI